MSVPVTATFFRWALACAALFGASAFHGDAYAQGYPAQVYPPGQAQQQQSANPMCGRLEAQLATIDRGNGIDPARADQIRRYEDSISRQQAELDRVSQQARRMGCDSSGFFSLFSGQSAQCGPVNNQIQQMRGNLDQMTNSLERLRVGTPGLSDRDSQRRSVLLALAQNGCGPQYAAAARSAQQNSGPGGFLSNLFGNNESSPGEIPPAGDAMMSNVPQGTYRTVCVRTCDGYYFPISFTTVPARFADDERACKAQCPATDANLYTYRNPGEDMNAAVSIAGQPYSSSPNAFKYRTEFNPSCSCKAQGQTWADALKTIDDKAAAENGDIIVTEERAKRLSQPQKGTPAALKKNATPDSSPAPAQQPATPSNPGQIRQVGPQFLPNNAKQ